MFPPYPPIYTFLSQKNILVLGRLPRSRRRGKFCFWGSGNRGSLALIDTIHFIRQILNYFILSDACTHWYKWAEHLGCCKSETPFLSTCYKIFPAFSQGPVFTPQLRWEQRKRDIGIGSQQGSGPEAQGERWIAELGQIFCSVGSEGQKHWWVNLPYAILKGLP